MIQTKGCIISVGIFNTLERYGQLEKRLVEILPKLAIIHQYVDLRMSQTPFLPQ